MAEAPIMPLATDAYLADTTHMSTTEHGAYLLLLMTMWRAGGTLPSDTKILAKYARLSPKQFARIWPTLEPLFHVDGESIWHGKLQDFLDAVRRKSNKASDSARAKWRKTKKTGDANASSEQCERYAIHKPANHKPKSNTTTSTIPEVSDETEPSPDLVVVVRSDPSPRELIEVCSPVDPNHPSWDARAVAAFIAAARGRGWGRSDVLDVGQEARRSLGNSVMRSTAYLAAVLERHAGDRKCPDLPDKPSDAAGFAAKFFERRKSNG